MLKNWMGIFFYIGRASGQVWSLFCFSVSLYFLLLYIVLIPDHGRRECDAQHELEHCRC